MACTFSKAAPSRTHLLPAPFARNITHEKQLRGVIDKYMAAVRDGLRNIDIPINYNWR